MQDSNVRSGITVKPYSITTLSIPEAENTPIPSDLSVAGMTAFLNFTHLLNAKSPIDSMEGVISKSSRRSHAKNAYAPTDVMSFENSIFESTVQLVNANDGMIVICGA